MRRLKEPPPLFIYDATTKRFTLPSTSQSGPPRPEEIPTPRYTTRSSSERRVCRGVDLSVTSRNLEMHRHASREVEALRKAGGAGIQHLATISHGESSSEGFQSSDDDEDEHVRQKPASQRSGPRLLIARVVRTDGEEFF